MRFEPDGKGLRTYEYRYLLINAVRRYAFITVVIDSLFCGKYKPAQELEKSILASGSRSNAMDLSERTARARYGVVTSHVTSCLESLHYGCLAEGYREELCAALGLPTTAHAHEIIGRLKAILGRKGASVRIQGDDIKQRMVFFLAWLQGG
jgi:hypothetical protein